ITLAPASSSRVATSLPRPPRANALRTPSTRTTLRACMAWLLSGRTPDGETANLAGPAFLVLKEVLYKCAGRFRSPAGWGSRMATHDGKRLDDFRSRKRPLARLAAGG